MIHGVHQSLAVQDIDVHVVAGNAEKAVENRSEVRDPLVLSPSQSRWNERGCQRNAVRCVAIWNFRYRCCGRLDAMTIAAMHWVGTWRERLALSPSIWRVSR